MIVPRTLFILNDPPYGTERSYNALRLAGALSKREGEAVKIFLIGDAAGCAKKNQKVRLAGATPWRFRSSLPHHLERPGTFPGRFPFADPADHSKMVLVRSSSPASPTCPPARPAL